MSDVLDELPLAVIDHTDASFHARSTMRGMPGDLTVAFNERDGRTSAETVFTYTIQGDFAPLALELLTETDRRLGEDRALIVPQQTVSRGEPDCDEIERLFPQISPPEETDMDPELAEIIEVPPVLIGGLEGLQRRIRYPDAARRAGVEGLVLAHFMLREDGVPECIAIVTGLAGGVNEAVITAIMESAFEPGLQNGEPVRVLFSLPVRFRFR